MTLSRTIHVLCPFKFSELDAKVTGDHLLSSPLGATSRARSPLSSHCRPFDLGTPILTWPQNSRPLYISNVDDAQATGFVLALSLLELCRKLESPNSPALRFPFGALFCLTTHSAVSIIYTCTFFVLLVSMQYTSSLDLPRPTLTFRLLQHFSKRLTITWLVGKKRWDDPGLGLVQFERDFLLPIAFRLF